MLNLMLRMFKYLVGESLHFWPEKNQLPRFPPFPDASFCRPWMVGIGAAIAGPSGPAPPPLRGFAIREPLNANPPVGEPRPRVEPTLAASRRSLTAVSWASNLNLGV